MNSWQCLCEVANNMGYSVEYSVYTRPSGNSQVFYIISINGKKYIKSWPMQDAAREDLMSLVLNYEFPKKTN